MWVFRFLVRHVPYFAALRPEHAAALAQQVSLVSVPAGAPICVQGHRANSMLVLLSGSGAIYMKGRPKLPSAQRSRRPAPAQHQDKKAQRSQTVPMRRSPQGAERACVAQLALAAECCVAELLLQALADVASQQLAADTRLRAGTTGSAPPDDAANVQACHSLWQDAAARARSHQLLNPAQSTTQANTHCAPADGAASGSRAASWDTHGRFAMLCCLQPAPTLPRRASGAALQAQAARGPEREQYMLSASSAASFLEEHNLAVAAGHLRAAVQAAQAAQASPSQLAQTPAGSARAASKQQSLAQARAGDSRAVRRLLTVCNSKSAHALQDALRALKGQPSSAALSSVRSVAPSASPAWQRAHSICRALRLARAAAASSRSSPGQLHRPEATTAGEAPRRCSSAAGCESDAAGESIELMSQWGPLVATLVPGDVIGESALMHGQLTQREQPARRVSAVAQTLCHVLEVPAAAHAAAVAAASQQVCSCAQLGQEFSKDTGRCCNLHILQWRSTLARCTLHAAFSSIVAMAHAACRASSQPATSTALRRSRQASAAPPRPPRLWQSCSVSQP